MYSAENNIIEGFGSINTRKVGGFNYDDSLWNSLIIRLTAAQAKCIRQIYYSIGYLNINNWDDDFYIPRQIFARVTIFRDLSADVATSIFDPYYDAQPSAEAGSYTPELDTGSIATWLANTRFVDYDAETKLYDEIITKWGGEQRHFIPQLDVPAGSDVTIVLTNFYAANAAEATWEYDTSVDEFTYDIKRAAYMQNAAVEQGVNRPLEYWNNNYRDYRVLGVIGEYTSGR
jgi:hypothetical protein